MPMRYNPFRITAAASGSTTNLIPVEADGQFVLVSSSSANFIVRMPSNSEAQIGWRCRGVNGSTNAFEIRLAAGTSGIVNNVQCSTGKEALIPARNGFEINKVGDKRWTVMRLQETSTGNGFWFGPVPD